MGAISIDRAVKGSQGDQVIGVFMYKIIVFDFDGTLVDSNSIKQDGFYRVVEEDIGGAELMASVLGRVIGDRREIFKVYVEEGQSNATARSNDVGKFVDKYNSIVDEAISCAPEMPGASALLDKLFLSGCKLILSSATPLPNLTWVIEKRGWQHYFESVHGAPANKINTLEQLLAASSDSASTLAVVGDGIDDRQSAAAVGCIFFPVGEVRGAIQPEKIYSLFELQHVLLQYLDGHIE